MAGDDVQGLIDENRRLGTENSALRAENQRLVRRVEALEHRLVKGSSTSSRPPSSDGPAERAEQTQTRAQRRAEEKRNRRLEVRRRGKQPGAPGSSLEMATPDEVVESTPTSCAGCGADLADADVVGQEVRQVLDVPVPTVRCVEHRAQKKRCRCETTTTAAFAAQARGRVYYGPRLRAVALYLLYGQYLSVERTVDALEALTGATVSAGWVCALAAEAAADLTVFIHQLTAQLAAEPVVCVDETEHQVHQARWWLHTVATERHSFLFASRTRGKAAPDEAGVLPEFTGTIVHDRLSLYFSYTQATHALCGAHLLRDLAAVAQIDGQGWASAMAIVLTQLNDAATTARDARAGAVTASVLDKLLVRYDELVALGLAATYASPGHVRDSLEREARNLAVCFSKRKDEITRFATDLTVPFTNNTAERSFRTAKIHRKISGCFQAEAHARHFATIRSYLDTARKHRADALDVLTALFRGTPWTIPSTT